MNPLQALFVTVPSSSSKTAILQKCQRSQLDLPWEPVGDPISVTIGKNGITWDKKEGDGKSPAGIFPILTAFGDSAHYVSHFPYLTIEEGLECVDDPKSKYYNQFVTHTSACDWDSSEKMWLIGKPYNLGLVVGYNTDPVIAGMGSCIFIHIWNNPDKGTAGCTAMEERDLIEIVSWLDPQKHPLLIQLVHSE